MLPGPGAAAARLTDALRGGTHGREAERIAAAEVERRWPGTREQFRRAAEFHARAAAWAVTEGAARSVVFTAAGYPPSGWPGAALPHLDASIAAPRARFLYCSADEPITLVWHRTLRGDRRALACQAPAADPRQVAGMARMAGLEAPWSVQLQLCAHWWTGEEAAEVVSGYAEVLAEVAAGYAEALPPGSSLVLSVPVEGGQPAGGEMGRAVERATGMTPVGHSPGEIAGWLTRAGLRLYPDPGDGEAGAIDVRAWPANGWADGGLAAPLAVRVVTAAGLVP